jgi:16S rRNA C1402 (ribose-2'-O) methylase RsmI
MMSYVLIGLSLSLAGVSGLQFFYMIYLERMDREQKKRLHELERRCKHLQSRLQSAEQRVSEQNILLENLIDEIDEEEIWADVIDDR